MAPRILLGTSCLQFVHLQLGTQPISASAVAVRIGEHDLSATGETTLPEKTIAVAAIKNHESYSAATSSNDITVLELSEAVDLNVYTPAFMALTTDTTTFDGKTAHVRNNEFINL